MGEGRREDVGPSMRIEDLVRSTQEMCERLAVVAVADHALAVSS
jgi:hypothetical protein